MFSNLTLALLGCGEIARFHLAGMREQAPRISVTAAIDIDDDRANAFSERTGARAFATLDDALVGGDFDAVDIMLPHDLHESAVMRCFDAGKHVLLEKPMAPTLDACARILRAAERAGVVFMVAENAQYWPEVVKAKEVIDSGAIGEPVTARAAFANNPLRDGFFDPDAKSPWRFNAARAGRGITIDGGSHWIRPLRMWLGEIDSVVATTARPLADMQGESLARALLRFRGGITAAFDAIYLDSVFAPDDMWRVTGTTGELTISSRGGGLWLWNASRRRGELLLQSGGYPKSFGGEMKDFAAAVQVSCPASFWYFLSSPCASMQGVVRREYRAYSQGPQRGSGAHGDLPKGAPHGACAPLGNGTHHSRRDAPCHRPRGAPLK